MNKDGSGERSDERANIIARARSLRQQSCELAARVLEVRLTASQWVDRAEDQRRRADDAQRVTAELRGCLEKYVATLRYMEETPERAVAEVKSIAREAARTIADGPRLAPNDWRGFTDDIVRWTIDAYYAS